MSQELLYTSAPHGLKPGSRGFCTVLSTQGMPAPLATGLEALSGYRPVFPPSDSRAHMNPVVWSHVTLTVAGRAWHVLSRISDFGLDYSQRTNKLAHHVVVDPGEQVECGPAQLLGLSGFMRSDWDHEPRLVPPKPTRQMTSAPPGICRAWKEITGDAGWAGVLAESYLREPERPVFLLYEPGQEILPLIAEALSLLPPERRWEVTFSTYFTGLPQGVGCVWRCMLKDSPEAQQSRRFAKALRIDLTGDPAGPATGGELVELARKGKPQAPLRPLRSPVRPDRGTQFSTESAASEHGPDDDSNDIIVEDDSQTPPAPPALTGGTFQRKERGPFELLERDPGRRTLADVHRELHQRSRRRWMLTGVVVFSMALLGALGFVGFKYRHLLEKPPKVHEVTKATASTSTTKSTHPLTVADVSAPKKGSVSELSNRMNDKAIAIEMPPPTESAAPVLGENTVVQRSSAPSAQQRNEPALITLDNKTSNADSKTISLSDEKMLPDLTKVGDQGSGPLQARGIAFESVKELECDLFTPQNVQIEAKRRSANRFDIGMFLDHETTSEVPREALLTLRLNLDKRPPVLTLVPTQNKILKHNELCWCVVDVMLSANDARRRERLSFFKEEIPLYRPVGLTTAGNCLFSLPSSFSEKPIVDLVVDTIHLRVGSTKFLFDPESQKQQKTSFDSFMQSIGSEQDAANRAKFSWQATFQKGLANESDQAPAALSIRLELKDWKQSVERFHMTVLADTNEWTKEMSKSLPDKISDGVRKSRQAFLAEVNSLAIVNTPQFEESWNSFKKHIPKDDSFKDMMKSRLDNILVRLQILRDLHSAEVTGARIYYKLHKYGDPKISIRRYLVDFVE